MSFRKLTLLPLAGLALAMLQAGTASEALAAALSGRYRGQRHGHQRQVPPAVRAGGVRESGRLQTGVFRKSGHRKDERPASAATRGYRHLLSVCLRSPLS